MRNKKFFSFLLSVLIISCLYPSHVMASVESALPDTEAGAGANEEQDTEADVEADTPGQPAEAAAVPDSVSTGAELMGWLEAHKDTGGAVKLTDNIVLDGAFNFVLASSAPTGHILVDAAEYTITAAGMIEFWSNAHLTFRGQPGGHSIFHVAKGGMLSLNGVSVECGQSGEEQSPENAPKYALWQEESAGLVVSDCQVSGGIHYADTPFVLYKNSTYALVETGQTADGVLPTEMKCAVNYQGQVNPNKPVQVSWDLAGTEGQQEKRLRFQVRGSYTHAASATPPVCVVVYNDHPLTFTEVETRVSESSYIFQGGYTKPEEFQRMRLTSEYSFDGVDWIVYDETIVMDSPETFFMDISFEVWNIEEHPYLYIRQWGEYDGIQYFSNVLRYAAGNLETAEDRGGDRGGMLPAAALSGEPQQASADAPSDNAEAGSGTEAKPSDNAEAGSGTEAKPSDNAGTENGTETKPGGSTGTGNGTETKPTGSAGAGNGAETKPTGSAGTGSGTETKPSGNAGTENGTEAEPSGNSGAGIGIEAKPSGSTGAGIGTETKPSGSTGAGSGKETRPSVSTGAGIGTETKPSVSAEAEKDTETKPSGSMTKAGGSSGTGAAQTEKSSGQSVVETAGQAGGQTMQNASDNGEAASEQNVRQSRTIIIVSVFVILSFVVGAAGFCVHAGIFRRLFHAVRELLS